MAQFLRPDGTISSGGWSTATTFHEATDEGVASNDGDTTMVQSSSNPANDVLELSTNSPGDTPGSGDHIIRAVWRKNAAGGRTISGTLDLVQGSTVIATVANSDVIETYVTTSYTLTSGEVANITDYSDLRLRVTGNTIGTGAGRGLRVTAIEMEVPDASGGTTHDGAAALSGAGSLAASARRTLSGSASVSGAAGLSPAGHRVLQAAAALSGSGAVAAVAQRVKSGAAALAGAGAVTAAAQRLVQGAAALAGTGSLAGTAQRLLGGAASLVGQAQLAASGTITGAIEGVAALAASGSLTAAGQCIAQGAAALAGQGAMSAAGRRLLAGATTLAGVSAMAAAGVVGSAATAAASLAGSATLAAAGQRLLQGRATLAAEGGTAAAGQGVYATGAALAGAAVLAARAAVPAITGRIRMVFSARARRMDMEGRAGASAIAFSVKKPGVGFGGLDE